MVEKSVRKLPDEARPPHVHDRMHDVLEKLFPDVVRLMLIQVEGQSPAAIARELSRIREVEGETVYGVRWTAVVDATQGFGLHGVFAAVRGRDKMDMQRFEGLIDGVLHPPDKIEPKLPQEGPLKARRLNAPPGQPEAEVESEVEVGEFWRDGAREAVGHDGLP